jgi:hypothetical protein
MMVRKGCRLCARTAAGNLALANVSGVPVSELKSSTSASCSARA